MEARARTLPTRLRRPPTTVPDRRSVHAVDHRPRRAGPRSPQPVVRDTSTHVFRPRRARRHHDARGATACGGARRGPRLRGIPRAVRSHSSRPTSGFDEDTVLAALLHDTLEDTDLDPRVIADRFGGPGAQDGWRTSRKPPAAGALEKRGSSRISSSFGRRRGTGSLAIASADKIHNLTKMAAGIEARGRRLPPRVQRRPRRDAVVPERGPTTWPRNAGVTPSWRSTGDGSTPFSKPPVRSRAAPPGAGV